MKIRIYTALLALVTLLMPVSCTKEMGVSAVVGEWNCSVEASGVKIDVWLAFSENGTFEMYQKVGDGVYWRSKGVFGVTANGLLSGVYSDNTPWEYEYRFTVDGSVLVMTASTDESYSNTYTKGTIPQSVREKCLELTKSSDAEVYISSRIL